MLPKHILVLVILAALARPAAAQINFGTAELGEIRTACTNLCFTQEAGECDSAGTIQSIAINPPFFVRGIRRGNVADDLCNNPQDANAVNLPANLQPGQALIFDVDLVATEIGPANEDVLVNGGALTPALAQVMAAGPCPQGTTDALCLQDDRFTVRANWRAPQGPRGKAPFVQNVQSNDSGLFYFFDEDNWEMLLKVLNGCPVNNRFWVFYGATTNVEFTVTVTDTQQDLVRTYFNPQGNPAAPIQDTNAFATCP